MSIHSYIKEKNGNIVHTHKKNLQIYTGNLKERFDILGNMLILENIDNTNVCMLRSYSEQSNLLSTKTEGASVKITSVSLNKI